MFNYFYKTIGFGFILAMTCMAVNAAEFRRFDAIKVVPKKIGDVTLQHVDAIRPVPLALIEKGIAEIVQSWNGPDFASYVSNRAYDKSRLLDAVDNYVPRDASLRLLSLEDSHTLNQYESQDDHGHSILISEVSVELTTQVEFEDPAKGFQRRNGRMELILEVIQEYVSER